MTRARRSLADALAALTSPVRRVLGWWLGLESSDQVLYQAVVLIGIGAGLVYPPAGLIAPGAVLLLVFFGFDLRRRA